MNVRARMCVQVCMRTSVFALCMDGFNVQYIMCTGNAMCMV